jgi:hypothetical protein
MYSLGFFSVNDKQMMCIYHIHTAYKKYVYATKTCKTGERDMWTAVSINMSFPINYQKISL